MFPPVKDDVEAGPNKAMVSAQPVKNKSNINKLKFLFIISLKALYLHFLKKKQITRSV